MSTTDAGASPLKKGKKKHRRGRKLETAQDSSASGNYPAQGQTPVRDVGQVPQNTERESSSEPSTNTEKQKRRRHRLSETEQTAPTGPARDRFPAMQEGSTPSTLLSTDSLVSPKADAYKPEKDKPTKRRDNRKKSKLEAEACLEVPNKKQKRRRHRKLETEQAAPTGPARDRSPAMQEGSTPSTLLCTNSLVSPTADAYKPETADAYKPEKEKPTKRRHKR